MRIIRDKMHETELRLQEAVQDGDKFLIEMLQAKLEDYYKLIMVPTKERFIRQARIYIDDPVNFKRSRK